MEVIFLMSKNNHLIHIYYFLFLLFTLFNQIIILFILNRKGYPTKELQSVYNATSLGFITGFLLGGINKVKDIREIHKKENQATLYEHKFYAYRDVQNKISSALTKGGISFGIKVGFFCFLFS